MTAERMVPDAAESMTALLDGELPRGGARTSGGIGGLKAD
jgi:hypothetical protein